MHPKRITIDATIRNNGTSKRAKLNGFAYVDAGFLVGDVAAGSPFTASELTLLTAFSFTGCPIAARTATPEINPWRSTGGTYVGRRHLDLDGATAKSVLTSFGAEDVIDMTLEIDVTGMMPTLSGIAEPFQEHIRQHSSGNLDGHFEMDFVRDDGTLLHAVARTRYELPIETSSSDAWRNITILAYGDVRGFHQVEQIDLFGNELEANEDLRQKVEIAGR